MALDGQGRVLAAVFNSSDIHDISSGGDFSGAAAFAWGLPGFGDTALDSVPGVGPSGAASRGARSGRMAAADARAPAAGSGA